MRRHAKRRAAAAMIGVAAVLGVAAAGTASAAPGPRLPDADLFCSGSTLRTGEWTSVPGSDSLWIFEGPMAGHYVILSDSHYIAEGYVDEPPLSYEGLPMAATKTWGAKAGLTDSVRCDFVSRWGEPGGADTFSVVGPITMTRVGP